MQDVPGRTYTFEAIDRRRLDQGDVRDGLMFLKHWGPSSVDLSLGFH